MSNTLTYHTVTGSFYSNVDPIPGGDISTTPQTDQVGAYVKFSYRLPDGFTVLIPDFDPGDGSTPADASVMFPDRVARLMNGKLCTIEIGDPEGVEIISNSAVLTLADRGITGLYVDVAFFNVTAAANQSGNLQNFAYLAPTDGTPVCLTDPLLTTYTYGGTTPYIPNWQAPETVSVTPTGEALMTATNVAAVIAFLNLASIFQALDSDLTAIAALTSAANKLPYATGAGAWALTNITAAARAFLAAASTADERTAIGAVGVSDLPGLGIGLELFQDFTIAPDGSPGNADTGQTPTLTYIDASNVPVIDGGRFVSHGHNAGTGAGYLTWPISGNITYMETDFQFDVSGSTTGQVAAIGAWHANLPSGAIGAVPDSPCHLIGGQTSYSMQGFSGGSNVPIGTVNYTPRGTGLQHFEVALDHVGDGTNGYAYVRAPDGVITRFSHPLIHDVTAQFAFCEVFYPHANTDNRIAFSRYGASALPITSPSRGRQLIEDWKTLNGGPIYPTIGFMRDSIGQVILNLVGTASAVNYLNLKNSVTTGRPGLQADGTDTNIGIVLIPRGNGDIQIYQSSGPVTLNAAGSDTNVDFHINAQGTGTIKFGSVVSQAKVDFFKDTNGNVILNLIGVASAVNYLDIKNNVTTGRPGFVADGADTNVGFLFQPKGTGDFQIYQSTGGVTLSASGNDTNVDLNITTKGIGKGRVNGSEIITQANAYETEWTAKDSGLIGWSFDPATVFAGVAPTGNAGIPYLVAVPIRAATTVTNVLLGIYQAGASLTSGQCFAALYQGGNLLAATADQSTAWTSTGVKVMALSSPQAVTAGVVYVAFFFNGTTPPQFWSAVCAAGNAAVVGVGTPSRWGVDNAHTGRTTSFPAASSITIPVSQGFWAGVS